MSNNNNNNELTVNWDGLMEWNGATEWIGATEWNNATELDQISNLIDLSESSWRYQNKLVFIFLGTYIIYSASSRIIVRVCLYMHIYLFFTHCSLTHSFIDSCIHSFISRYIIHLMQFDWSDSDSVAWIQSQVCTPSAGMYSIRFDLMQFDWSDSDSIRFRFNQSQVCTKIRFDLIQSGLILIRFNSIRFDSIQFILSYIHSGSDIN